MNLYLPTSHIEIKNNERLNIDGTLLNNNKLITPNVLDSWIPSPELIVDDQNSIYNFTLYLKGETMGGI